MIRLVIAALLLYLLFVLVYSSLKGRSRKGRGKDARPGDDMVLDPHCKSYVPKKDAIASKGHYFCSRECAEAYSDT